VIHPSESRVSRLGSSLSVSRKSLRLFTRLSNNSNSTGFAKVELSLFRRALMARDYASTRSTGIRQMTLPGLLARSTVGPVV